MYLSNRLTFSIFSILLVAALFIAPAAMAQVTVSMYKVDTLGNADDKAKTVFTFTYSETPNPRPVLADFTADDDALTTPADTDETARDVLTSPYSTDGSNSFTAVVGGSGKMVTLTLETTENTNTAPTVPTGLMLKGYQTAISSAADRTTDASATPTPLVLAENHLAGYGYRVYLRPVSTALADVPAAADRPVLPSTLVDANLATIDPTATTGNSNMAMPDLEEFFNVGGGTINLKVAGTAKDSRHVIINEIMWGLDNSKVGQDGELQQQWIEVYNRLTTPAPNPTFEFIDNTFPAPATAAGTSDRITNIAGHQNVWNPPIKGSSGTATRNTDGTAIIGANPPFVSIYRNPDKQNADGANAGHWTASNRPYFPGFMGTPGSANTRGGLPSTRDNPGAYTPPKDKIIINEVGNYAGTGDNLEDWIELRNVSTGDVNIENWRLNRTTGAANDFTEHNIVQFPKHTIPAGEVLLIVNKDPADTDLIEGTDVRADGNQRRGHGPHKYLNIKRSHNRPMDIPAMDTGFLILRSHGDNKFLGSRQHLHDVVGYARVSRDTIVSGVKEPESGNTYWKTGAWPINGHTGDNYRPHDAKDANNNNASLHPDADFRNGNVWARSGTAHGWRKGGGGHAGFSGGIGYDRGVKKGGTPGYHNDVVKNVVANLDGGQLIISELMLTTDDGRYPQWIELHNTSKTRGIDLAADGTDPKVGWRMIIENHNSGKWREAAQDKTVVTINLKELFSHIPPNQTVLIVSDTARNSGTTMKVHFPNHRVASIWDLKKDDFLMANRRDSFLNAEGGFYIKIIDANDAVSDEIGNLDGKKADIRGGVPYDDPFGWNWPTDMASRNERTSLIRLKNADKTHRAGTPIRPVADDPETDADETVAANETRGAVIPLGTDLRGMGMNMVAADYSGYAWVHAVDTKLAKAQSTYYGVDTDHGTPGHTANTPLPVELSFFRPTLEDGQVTIQWTTESELDNAGFNILRSDSRDGEFKQVNEQMIQGKGTTAERSAYKWVDTAAKPGAVYYYQIEDVSFAGEHNTLATTKLKGLISAKGKLTTSWGNIKNASQ
ncbi:lamin tail domain-containing protein [Candidatus Poribacteria bacterium]|nr:lamin tail domain-containing protein [Candidatus Poribacteria bacterium]